MQFEFATAARILFGAGTVREVPALAKTFGSRALLVSGKSGESAALLREALNKEQQITCVTFTVEQEPSIERVLQGVALAKVSGAQMVISIGGGSVLDTGKAIAALATNPGDPFDYLEVIGKNQPLTQEALPFIAVPTTAGTGSEVTRNAVMSSPEHRVKVSLRSPLMLARAAVVDPELTYTLPPALTASTGMDALTQCIEPYVSIAANPITDGLALEGIRRAGRALRAAYEGDTNAREDMALASLFGGLALANAKLGAVHGFAGPLGGMYDAPHGALCAALLPHVMEVNIHALREREPNAAALHRYAVVAQALTGYAQAEAEDGVQFVAGLCKDMHIPSLAGYGVREEDFPEIIEKSAKSGSMKGNPLTLTADEMAQVLRQAL